MSTAKSALTIDLAQDADIEAIVGIWERCGLTRPWNDPRADIALALRGPNSTILMGKHAGSVIATAMVGHDGHRGWLYYLGVDPLCQGRGFGRVMTTAAEDWLKLRGLKKIELLIRIENTKVQGFYESIGYNVEPRTVMTKWLDGRDPTP